MAKVLRGVYTPRRADPAETKRAWVLQAALEIAKTRAPALSEVDRRDIASDCVRQALLILREVEVRFTEDNGESNG